MFKKLLLAVFATLTMTLISTTALAATDINKASQAELEEVKGIGPAMSTRILEERKKSAFKNWDDVVERVKGVGPGNAAKFSSNGLTVNGEVFKASVTTPKAENNKVDRKAKADANKETKAKS